MSQRLIDQVSLAILLLSLVTSGAAADTMWTNELSFDGRTDVKMELRDGRLFWSASRDGEPLIAESALGVEIDGQELAVQRVPGTGWEITDHHETVETAWGKFASYGNDHKEWRWKLQLKDGSDKWFHAVLRIYDSAIAIRYEFPKEGGWGDEVNVTGELTEFRFVGESSGWSCNGEREPHGPYPLNNPPLKQLNPPLTIRRDGGGYAAILEAATFEQAPMKLVPTGDGGLRVKAPRSVIKNGHTSWRVILLGDEAGDLLTSPAPYCLNPPCAIEDTSWIEPGLAFWDWRAWGAKTDDGFTYGLDMASWRRFIDFASESNVKYLVLDANWYGPEHEASSDPRTSRDHLIYQPRKNSPKIARKAAPADWADPIDVPAIIAYGKERGVGLILYINDVARLNYPFEETLALYEKWGAAGIKYGFMKGRGQAKVLATREIVRLCAKHHLLCNFHDGPVPPSGDERTYPNYVVREFCHAQTDSRRSFSPTTFCKQVFVNMLAGPLDMNNGLYALENPAGERPMIAKNVESTVVSETARVLVTYAGMPVLTDCPEEYAKKADLFEFLSRLPLDWDETRILSGGVGEHITTARRAGDTWYLGSVTNEEARELPIKLDFLKPGVAYRASHYEDAPDAHFKTNREAYQVRESRVASTDTITAKLAPGGGHCLILEPIEAPVGGVSDADNAPPAG